MSNPQKKEYNASKAKLEAEIIKYLHIERLVEQFLGQEKGSYILFKKCAEHHSIKEKYSDWLRAYHCLSNASDQTSKGHNETPCKACRKWLSKRVNLIRSKGAVPKRGRPKYSKNKTKTASILRPPPLKQRRLNRSNEIPLALSPNIPNAFQCAYSSFGSISNNFLSKNSFNARRVWDNQTSANNFNLGAQQNEKKKNVSQFDLSNLPSISLFDSPPNISQNQDNKNLSFPCSKQQNLPFSKAPIYFYGCEVCDRPITKEEWCWPCSAPQCPLKHIHCTCTYAFWNAQNGNFDALCSEHWLSRCDKDKLRDLDARPFWIKCVGHDHKFSYFIRFNHDNTAFYHYAVSKYSLSANERMSAANFDKISGYTLTWENSKSIRFEQTRSKIERAQINGSRVDICNISGPILLENQRQSVHNAMDLFDEKIQKEMKKIKQNKDKKKKHKPKKWMKGVQANNKQRTKFHCNEAYDTNEALRMFRSHLKFDKVFPMQQDRAALNELKRNIIIAAKHMNVPFDQFSFLLQDKQSSPASGWTG